VDNLTTFLIILIGKIYEALKKEEHRPKKENNGANSARFQGSMLLQKRLLPYKNLTREQFILF
jgi:hypothetical protein